MAIRKAELGIIARFGQRVEISENDIERRLRFRIYDPLFRKECNYQLMVVMNYVREVNPDESGFGDSTETWVRGYVPANIDEYNQLCKWYSQNQQAKEDCDFYSWNSEVEPIFHLYLVDTFGSHHGSVMSYGMKQTEFESQVKTKSPRKF